MINIVKRMLAIVLVMTISFQSIEALAQEKSTNMSEIEIENNNVSDAISQWSGLSASNVELVNKLIAERKFHARQGHGFAAELGNNFIDRLQMKDATIVGNDNVKDGADRKIVNKDGSIIWIQDKYYADAKSSINACFDESGNFRYIDGDGKPQQIEVASDQFDDAVLLLKDRIKEGKLKNVNITNPDEAENIIRKGKLTYKQAANLAKAGTIESLTYDAANGIVNATYGLGISTTISLVISCMNGDSLDVAAKNAALDGVKVGGTAFATTVISSQIARTGVGKAFEASSEAVAKALGPKVAKAMVEAYKPGTVVLTNQAAISGAAKILQSNMITGTVTVVVLSIDDIYNIFNGKISTEQFIKNIAVTTGGVAGGTAGWIAGSAIGTAVAPGAGTYVGGTIGSTVGGVAGSFGTEMVVGIFIEDDAEKMYEIIEKEFHKLCDEYLINTDEANKITGKLQAQLTGDILQEMYASKNQTKYARELMEGLFTKQVAEREKIELPSENMLREELKASLEGVIFIH